MEVEKSFLARRDVFAPCVSIICSFSSILVFLLGIYCFFHGTVEDGRIAVCVAMFLLLFSFLVCPRKSTKGIKEVVKWLIIPPPEFRRRKKGRG